MLQILKPIYFTRFFRLSLLNPFTILFFTTVPLIIFKAYIGPAFILKQGLFDQYFQYAIFMTNIYFFGELLVSILALNFFKKTKILDNFIISIKHTKRPLKNYFLLNSDFDFSKI